ncbi:hypothetical protein Q5M87_08445 [Brachyspira innocens]|uniref:Uncharacterized protein n=1 Tax=Brachyspira innocens TaxID=13264 RepID=A0ABT8Z0V7_9SPIR|nr:hypothetical protein [Brachyspira innocens]MDO6994036.1 hypothetical protein [Brachyspira innocens]MDO7021466.1 hypothetical protein [Brachyspira innocens]
MNVLAVSSNAFAATFHPHTISSVSVFSSIAGSFTTSDCFFFCTVT